MAEELKVGDWVRSFSGAVGQVHTINYYADVDRTSIDVQWLTGRSAFAPESLERLTFPDSLDREEVERWLSS